MSGADYHSGAAEIGKNTCDGPSTRNKSGTSADCGPEGIGGYRFQSPILGLTRAGNELPKGNSTESIPHEAYGNCSTGEGSKGFLRRCGGNGARGVRFALPLEGSSKRSNELPQLGEESTNKAAPMAEGVKSKVSDGPGESKSEEAPNIDHTTQYIHHIRLYALVDEITKGVGASFPMQDAVPHKTLIGFLDLSTSSARRDRFSSCRENQSSISIDSIISTALSNLSICEMPDCELCQEVNQEGISRTHSFSDVRRTSSRKQQMEFPESAHNNYMEGFPNEETIPENLQLLEEELSEMGAVGPIPLASATSFTQGIDCPMSDLAQKDLSPKASCCYCGSQRYLASTSSSLENSPLESQKPEMHSTEPIPHPKTVCFYCKSQRHLESLPPSLKKLPSEKKKPVEPPKKSPCGKRNLAHPPEEVSLYPQKINLDSGCCEGFSNLIVRIDNYMFQCRLAPLQCYTHYFTNLSQMADIRLPSTEVTADAFRKIYQWAISKNPRISTDNIIEVLRGATYLKIPVMLNQLWQCLDNEDYYNEFVAFKFSLELQRYPDLNNLEDLMLHRVRKCFLFLYNTLEFAEMPLRSLQTLISSNYIAVNTEIEVFYAAIIWLHHKWPHREPLIPEVIKCIRFALFPMGNLFELLKLTPYVFVNHLTKRADVRRIMEDAMFNHEIIRSARQNPSIFGLCKDLKIPMPRPRLFLYNPEICYHEERAEQTYSSINFKNFKESAAKLANITYKAWTKLKVTQVRL